MPFLSSVIHSHSFPSRSFACRSSFQEAAGPHTSGRTRNKASLHVLKCLHFQLHATCLPSAKTLVPLNLCSRDAEPGRFPEQPQPGFPPAAVATGHPSAPASAVVHLRPVVFTPGYWRKSSPHPGPANTSEAIVTRNKEKLQQPGFFGT